jgi:Phosphodiester glycosidase
MDTQVPSLLRNFAWLLGLLAASALMLYVWPPQSGRPFLSRWSGGVAVQSVATTADAQPNAASALVMQATPDPSALESYNQGSLLQDADPSGRVRFYRRDVAGGSIAYFVVTLDQQVHLEVINADGATPGSDASGNTIWLDRQKHLATVAQMAQAPYAERDGMRLLGAMAFGFHGAERTSDEGSVVINGRVLRANPGRAALCVTSAGQAMIGLFDANALGACAQAIGGGPVILWRGKIANPAVGAQTDRYLPFNPLGEDFVQLEWRKKIYSGSYPKTVIGTGTHADGRAYLVMLISKGVGGLDLAEQLKALGCTDALGGDDDSSTQAVWRGAPVQSHNPRAVPDALGVYLRSQ